MRSCCVNFKLQVDVADEAITANKANFQYDQGHGRPQGGGGACRGESHSGFFIKDYLGWYCEHASGSCKLSV